MAIPGFPSPEKRAARHAESALSGLNKAKDRLKKSADILAEVEKTHRANANASHRECQG
jgi:hypothetical protein